MNIKIIKGTTRHNGKEYGPNCENDVIKQIKKVEGDRLISLGVAVDFDEIKSSPTPEPKADEVENNSEAPSNTEEDDSKEDGDPKKDGE